MDASRVFDVLGCECDVILDLKMEPNERILHAIYRCNRIYNEK